MPVDVLRFSMSDIIKHADDGTLGVLAEQIAQRLRPDDDPDGTPTLSGSLKTLESTLPDLCTAAKRADIAAEALIEYPTPGSRFRADVVLIGSRTSRRWQKPTPSVLVIEVRDWASLNEADRHIKRETAGLPRVSYRRSGRRHELRHPGLVAREHAQLIASFSGAFQKRSTVRAAAYLPNAQAPLIRRLERDASSDPSAQDAPEVSFVGQDTVADLTDYLKAHFDSGPEAAGRSKALADRYLADRFRPTADLLGDATAQLDRATEFQLTPDQQRIVDEVSKDVIEAMAPRRRLFAGAGRPSEQEDRKGQVVIVEGSPGTGKTVVGVELLKNAWRRGWNARYASPSSAFNENMRRCFGTGDQSARELFTTVRSLHPYAGGALDLLIIDEAHRLPEFPWTWQTSVAARSDRRPTIDEAFAAAKCLVFFVDASQQVRPADIGDVDLIERAARKHQYEVRRHPLTKGFRAGGAEGYDAWLRRFLGIDSTAQPPLQPWAQTASTTAEKSFSLVTVHDPEALEAIIRSQQHDGAPGAHGRARLTAGFAWPWSDYERTDDLPPDVSHRSGWSMPWNARHAMTIADKPVPEKNMWATGAGGIDQVGCVYTAQGFEFGWVGVLFGEDLVRRGDKWVSQKSKSHDQAIRRATDHDADRAIRSAYRVLMTRGLAGVAICSVDDKTQRYFEELVEKAS